MSANADPSAKLPVNGPSTGEPRGPLLLGELCDILARAKLLTAQQAKDVEGQHANLYKRALTDVIAQRSTEYYVCSVCGHVHEREAPETCPICGAPKTAFEKVL